MIAWLRRVFAPQQVSWDDAVCYIEHRHTHPR
jgi:hypothetical protein